MTFNRTIKELKPLTGIAKNASSNSFNRTIKELKQQA